jgi:hypothetical protein
MLSRMMQASGRRYDPGPQGPPNGPDANTWPGAVVPTSPNIHFVFHPRVAPDAAVGMDWAHGMVLVWTAANHAPERPWVDLHAGSLGKPAVQLLRESSVEPRFAIRADREGSLPLPKCGSTTGVGVAVRRIFNGAYAASMWLLAEASGEVDHDVAYRDAVCCIAALVTGYEYLVLGNDSRMDRVALYVRAERTITRQSLTRSVPGGWDSVPGSE